MKILFRIFVSLMCQMSLAACLQYKSTQEDEDVSTTVLDVIEEPTPTDQPQVETADDLIAGTIQEPLENGDAIEIPSVEDIYDIKTLKAWYQSDFVQKATAPAENTIQVCAAPKCEIKLDFEFSQDHLERIADAMVFAMDSSEDCNRDTPACERRGLSQAMVEMEMIIHDQLLIKQKSNKNLNHLDLDSIDQATNAISYLVVLANNGWVRHHHILEPGMEYFGASPHFFARLIDENGDEFKFDLYHRGSFGLRPYIKLL